jgi:hypothetical protein
MFNRIGAVVFGLAVIVSAALARPAMAAQPDTGVYAIVDPYTVKDYTLLQKAASTPCPATQSAKPASTFCGGVDGVLLRIGWCNFEPDHASEGMKWNSCHYVLGYKSGSSGPAVQMPVSSSPEYTTSCGGNFDTCGGANPGVMGEVLGFLNKINAYRAATRYLPPLKLSIGLESGLWTPETVLAAAGSVDVPTTQSGAGVASDMRCGRLPRPWVPAYQSDYDTAIDQLLGFVAASMPNGGNVQILKLAGITTFDLETIMPGEAVAVAAPNTDPKSPSAPMGGAMACSSTEPGAQVWLDAYEAAPIAGRTFTQAVEYAFGQMAGHAAASLQRNGMSATLSIAQTGTTAFTAVDCGMSGAGPCSISPLNGDYSVYYLTRYVTDLFDGGLSGQAAASAFDAVLPGAAFTLSPGDVSLVWTGLTNQPIVAIQQPSCMLNNTNPANDPVMNLNGTLQSIGGVATMLGWQTQTQLAGTCAARAGNTYMAALENGVAQGGRYLEVEDDAAFTDFSTCGTDLATASSQLMSSQQQTCQY